MNRIELLKKLLPGFLPLFVFIAADEIWGTTIGMFVAVGFGIVQLAYTLIREKRFDKFVLIDTLLIVALGVVSILLDDPKFILFKPILIELVLVILLGVSGFTPYNFMLSMSKRYMKGIEMNNAQIKQLIRSIRIMFFIFIAHAGLAVYSVFYMTSSQSVFISGGLFYIIFGAYFVFEFARNKLKAGKIKNEEWLPIVDEKGKVIGKAPRSVVHGGEKLLHPVVHLHVVNKAKQLYLQKRADDKLVQPGKWDTAVGGHLGLGEGVEDALRREAKEEIGIEVFAPRPIYQYKFESDIEKELVFSFITQYNEKINPPLDEVTEGRFWSIKEIKDNLGKNVFTPNFELEFEMLRKRKII